MKIPSSLEDLLPLTAFERVMDSLHRPELSQKVRDAIGRVSLKDVNPLEQVQEAWKQARSWIATIAGDSAPLGGQRLNATGSLFGAGQDAVPTILSVSLSYARSVSSFHDRGQVLQRSSQVVHQTLGVSQVDKRHIWLSAPAMALQVVAKSLGPRGILLPRSDSVRLPGIGNIHSILSAQGSSVEEVGATNGATVHDWADAFTDADGKVVITVSPNSLSGQSSDASRSALFETARDRHVPVVELLVDATPNKNLAAELGFPSLTDRANHPNVLLIPANFLMGGVQGVLCLGPEAAISTIAHKANLLGGELDSAAVLANLLALQVGTLEDDLDRGAIGALQANPENLRNRSQRLAMQIAGVGPISEAEVVDVQAPLGPSPWDRYRLHGPAIRLRVTGDALSIFQTLRAGSEAVPAIDFIQNGNELQIDLRFVPPDDDHKIVEACQALA